MKIKDVAKNALLVLSCFQISIEANAQNRPHVINNQCISATVVGAGSAQTWSYDIKTLPNKGFISVGSTSLNSNKMNVPGHHNSDTTSGFDGFLVYGDANGDIIWKKYFGGSGNDDLNSLTLMENGDFLVVGKTNSIDGKVHGYRYGTLPAYGGTTTTSYDALAIRVNTDGDTVWSKTFGTHGDDVFNGVVMTRDNHYVFVGSTDSIGDHAHSWQPQHFVDYRGSLRASDAWIVKVDLAGDTLWTKTFGGSHNDALINAYPTSDSGIIAVGYTESTDLSSAYGSYDGLIIKFDKDGNVDWYKVAGGSAFDYLHEVIQLADGSGYALIGHTNGGDVDAENFHGGGQADVWLIVLDNTGNITKSICYGGTKGDFGNSIQEAPEGGFVIGGYTGSRDGDVSTMHNADGTDQDGWILKVDTVGAIIWDRNVGSTGSNTLGGKVRLFEDGKMIGTVVSNTYLLDEDISCVPNSESTFGWIYWLSSCPSYTYDTVTLCKGDSYLFGSQTITLAGIYWDTLTMASGCDSLIKLTLIVDSMATPSITATDNTIR